MDSSIYCCYKYCTTFEKKPKVFITVKIFRIKTRTKASFPSSQSPLGLESIWDPGAEESLCDAGPLLCGKKV